MGDESFERVNVTHCAKAGHLSEAALRDHGMVPKFLPSLRVREMHFDGRNARSEDRIEKRDRRVRVRASIEKNAGVPLVSRVADQIDDGALVIRLHARDAHSERLGARFDQRADVIERRASVDLGLARTELVEVRPRDDEDRERRTALQASSFASAGTRVRRTYRAFPMFASGVIVKATKYWSETTRMSVTIRPA
jgi:hypothetical protein